MKRILYLLAIAALVSSCGAVSSATRASQYPEMYEQKPLTLLVMPPINNTSAVEAKDYMYTSISRPLAEAGYYVISPLLSMDILKAESAYDSELFVEGPLTTFREFFGADAVVFCEINTWTKRGFGVDTDIHYFIRSAYTGEIIFERSCDLYLDCSISTGSNSTIGALVSLAASALSTALTEHIEAARKANYFIFKDIPRGKYSPDYMMDQTFNADFRDIRATVK